jgi:hypothetical protein
MEGQTMSASTKQAKQLPTAKSEADLISELEKIGAEAAELAKEIEGLEERRATELAGDANSKRLDEIEETIARFTRERARRLGRIKAIDERLIPAARREETRVTMEARVKEYDRQRGLLEQAYASVDGAIEMLSRVAAEIPWQHPHPELKMRMLKEEIGFDAAELAETPPLLQPSPHTVATDKKLERLVELASQLAGRLEYMHGWSGALTTRGREAEQRKRAEAAATYTARL